MHITLNAAQAAEMLRADDNASWSYNGARALVEYLEELENSTCIPYEFNAAEIRYEWSEYESAKDAAEQTLAPGWADDLDEGADEDEVEKAALKALEKRTMVVPFNGGVIIRDL